MTLWGHTHQNSRTRLWIRRRKHHYYSRVIDTSPSSAVCGLNLSQTASWVIWSDRGVTDCYDLHLTALCRQNVPGTFSTLWHMSMGVINRRMYTSRAKSTCVRTFSHMACPSTLVCVQLKSVRLPVSQRSGMIDWHNGKIFFCHTTHVDHW